MKPTPTIIPPIRIVEVIRNGLGRDGWYPQYKNANGHWVNISIESKGCDSVRHVHRALHNWIMREGWGDLAPDAIGRLYVQSLARNQIIHSDWEHMEWTGSAPHARALWIGGGESSRRLLDKNAAWFDNCYDVIACANYGWEAFAEVAQETTKAQWFWFNVEATGKDIWADKERWLRKIPPCFERILLCHESTFGSLDTAGTEGELPRVGTIPVTYTLVKKACNDPFLPREYGRGLQCGTGEEGTVSLQALHFFSILGCDTIDVYGMELGYTEDAPVHFYEDKYNTQPKWQLAQWQAAADYTRSLLPAFKKAGVKLNWKCRSKILEGL